MMRNVPNLLCLDCTELSSDFTVVSSVENPQRNLERSDNDEENRIAKIGMDVRRSRLLVMSDLDAESDEIEMMKSQQFVPN